MPEISGVEWIPFNKSHFWTKPCLNQSLLLEVTDIQGASCCLATITLTEGGVSHWQLFVWGFYVTVLISSSQTASFTVELKIPARLNLAEIRVCSKKYVIHSGGTYPSKQDLHAGVTVFVTLTVTLTTVDTVVLASWKLFDLILCDVVIVACALSSIDTETEHYSILPWTGISHFKS